MWIMIAGGDENRNGIHLFQLLLQKLDRVWGHAIMLEEVARNQDKRCLLGNSTIENAAKGASNGFAFAVTEARGESRSGKAGVQVQIGSMDESDRGH